jgi:hypothetical protein
MPKYSKRTISALKKSVKHWQENFDADYYFDISIYEEDCPLCSIFAKDNDCKGCPIRDYTGKPDCMGTPWYQVRTVYCPNDINFWESNDFFNTTPSKKLKNAIKKELIFLENLYKQLITT